MSDVKGSIYYSLDPKMRERTRPTLSTKGQLGIARDHISNTYNNTFKQKDSTGISDPIFRPYGISQFLMRITRPREGMKQQSNATIS